MFSQYCQKPFSNKEEEEAMEFEQLDEMFDEAEFSGLAGVGNGSATDIIQNALLTAGIENGLGSPSVTSVTDSDSVVTIFSLAGIKLIPPVNFLHKEMSLHLSSYSRPKVVT